MDGTSLVQSWQVTRMWRSRLYSPSPTLALPAATQRATSLRAWRSRWPRHASSQARSWSSTSSCPWRPATRSASTWSRANWPILWSLSRCSVAFSCMRRKTSEKMRKTTSPNEKKNLLHFRDDLENWGINSVAKVTQSWVYEFQERVVGGGRGFSLLRPLIEDRFNVFVKKKKKKENEKSIFSEVRWFKTHFKECMHCSHVCFTEGLRFTFFFFPKQYCPPLENCCAAKKKNTTCVLSSWVTGHSSDTVDHGAGRRNLALRSRQHPSPVGLAAERVPFDAGTCQGSKQIWGKSLLFFFCLTRMENKICWKNTAYWMTIETKGKKSNSSFLCLSLLPLHLLNPCFFPF